jgi:hypothetical protein
VRLGKERLYTEFWQANLLERYGTIIIQFNSLFIYMLNSTANGQLQSARIQTTAIRQHRTKQTTKQRKMDQLRLFKLKHDLLKISVDLQTAFAADIHLAEGQWLKEQLNVAKLRMFRVGTRVPTVSRTEGQYLVPLKTLKIIHRSNDA